MADASSAFTSTFMPAPGWNTKASTRPITSAMVVSTSKYTSALMPTRPTRFRSPAPAMPCTTTQNTSTGMIILISLMKPSPKGLSLTANSGENSPTRMPTASAMSTCPNSDLAKRPM